MVKPKLPKPKITFDRLGQITFTLKEVIKLAFRIKPKLLVGVFLLNALWGFSSIPIFYLEKLIIDKLIEAVGSTDWMPYLISAGILATLAIAVSLFRSFLGSVNSFLRRTLSRYFDAELNVLMGKKIASLDLPTLESSKFRDRFNKIERESGRRAWGLMVPISNIPNYLMGFVSAVGIIFFLSPLISLGVILVSIPRFLIDSKFIKKEYDLHTEQSTKHRVWGWINYYLLRNRNFMELKILNLTDHLSEKMRSIYNEILHKSVDLNKKREVSSFIGFLPLTLYELVVSFLLIYWVIIRKITVGSFQLYLRSLRSAEQNLSGLVSSLLEIYENYMYVTDLVWFLNLKTETEPGSKKPFPDKEKLSVEFKNVWFKYKKEQNWILKGVNLSFKLGDKIALVGENGVGKSTIIKILCGFYIPQKGEVLIGGENIKNINLELWREQLAVLFQEFELYPFSVRESIGYGDIKNINDLKRIKESVEKTGIKDFIEELPCGYDNPLTPEFEHGIQPSIGQWQRLGISRMLFRRNARVMILDEPTSNVDPEAEEKIFKELVRITKEKILVFVTQRFSTVRIADEILVVADGKIIEKGHHAKLMKKKGKYERLFTLQAKSFLESSKTK